MILLLAIVLVWQCASGTVILDCSYSVQAWTIVGNMYTCYAKVIQTGRTRNVVGVSQNHLSGKTNPDVKALWIEQQPIDFFPEDSDLFFFNLEVIFFKDCPIKSLTKEDLQYFSKLKIFGITGGELSTINGDVFKYSPELEHLSLRSNKITNVGPGIFLHSPKLSNVFFDNNLCIVSQAVDSTAAVTSIAKELAYKCPPTVEMIEEIILESQKFKTIIGDQVDSKVSAMEGRVKQLEERIRKLERCQKKNCS